MLGARGPRRAVAGMGLAMAWIVLPMLACEGKDIGLPEPTLRTHRVPIWVDGQTFASDVYLQFPFQPMDVALEEIDEGRHGSAAAVLAALLAAVRDGDTSRVASRIARQGTLDTEQGLLRYVGNFQRSILQLENLRIIGRIRSGAKTRLVVRGDTPTGSQTRIFTLAAGPEGSPVLDVGAVFGSVDSLINEIYRNASLSAKWYGPVSDSDLAAGKATLQRVAVPFDADAPLVGASAYFLFHGQVHNLDLLDSTQAADDPLLSFYSRAYRELADGGVDRFYGYLTEKSAQRLRSQIQQLDEGQQEELLRHLGARRYVRFVLEADPVYLVFYSDHPAGASQADYLRHDTVKRKVPSSYQIANLLYTTVLDDLIEDPDFQQRAIMPLILEYLAAQEQATKVREQK